MEFISHFTAFFRDLFIPPLEDLVNSEAEISSLYSRQLDGLAKVRRTIADLVTTQKRLEMMQSQIQEQSDKLGKQAELAYAAKREDLAHTAIERQQYSQSQIALYQQDIAKLEEEIGKFVQLERRYSNYIDTFRRRRELIKARQLMAQAQVKIGEIATGFSEISDDSQSEEVGIRKFLLLMEAHTNAINQMIEQGTLSEVGDLPNADLFFDLQIKQAISPQAKTRSQGQ